MRDLSVLQPCYWVSQYSEKISLKNSQNVTHPYVFMNFSAFMSRWSSPNKIKQSKNVWYLYLKFNARVSEVFESLEETRRRWLLDPDDEARRSGLLDPEWSQEEKSLWPWSWSQEEWSLWPWSWSQEEWRWSQKPDFECKPGRADFLILKMKPGRGDCLTLNMMPERVNWLDPECEARQI